MAPEADGEYVVDFPTLWIVPDWIERHCLMPSAMAEPAPLEMYDWQLWATVNHYRVKPDALPAGTRKRDGSLVSVAAAFQNRRSQIVAVQKSAKAPGLRRSSALKRSARSCSAASPTAARRTAAPNTGAAAAGSTNTSRASRWAPVGPPTDPASRHLRGADRQRVRTVADDDPRGPLADLMRVGEGFIRLPERRPYRHRHAKAQSKLGNPITFAMQDETGCTPHERAVGRADAASRRRRYGWPVDGDHEPVGSGRKQHAQQTVRVAAARHFPVLPASRPRTCRSRTRRIGGRSSRFCYRGSCTSTWTAIEAEAAELHRDRPAAG
jgi:hypothetical protein